VIAKSARIASAFARIGFTPDSGSTKTLTARMGPARAKRFFLLAETLDADAALSGRLVDVVVDDDAVAPSDEHRARAAAGPTEAYRGISGCLAGLEQRVRKPAGSRGRDAGRVSRTADAREGIKAFQENAAVFSGR